MNENLPVTLKGNGKAHDNHAHIECNLVIGGEDGEKDRADEGTSYATDDDLGGGHES